MSIVTTGAAPAVPAPTGAVLGEAEAFLAAHPDVDAIDLILTDLNGIGRGKIIRRHELKGLYKSGRALPATVFAQDIEGNDIEPAMAAMQAGSGDSRCWPVRERIGLQPVNGRGLVLMQMFHPDGTPEPHDPRGALKAQIARAEALGFTPMGALELEFYLVDPQRNADGQVRAVRAPLGGRRLSSTNCYSLDELDEMSPFFEAVYDAAEKFDLTLESLISEYAEGQFELTLQYRELARACDDIIIVKQLIRSTARRHGMQACFMAKPFGDRAGSGMHLHLSLADSEGANVFADPAEGALSPAMLNAIGGVRAAMRDSMLIYAPGLNSWRRFASTVYSPASNIWGVEEREVALRVPDGAPQTRHFENRLPGVDANPYLAAAAMLGAALDGIEGGVSPGKPGTEGADAAPALPVDWLEAIEAFEGSDAMARTLGTPLHDAFCAIKRAEYERLAVHVTEMEWQIYGAAG